MIGWFDADREFDIREIDRKVVTNINLADHINHTVFVWQMYDALQSRKNSSPIESFKQWKIPLDLIYQYSSNCYNAMTLDADSPYSQVMWHETRWLVLHRNSLQKYINPHIVDIWCGNAVKVWTLLSYMKHRVKLESYTGLDSWSNILQKAESFIDSQKIWLKKTEYAIQDFTKLEQSSEWNTTYFFVWWTFCNMSDLDQSHFLQQLYDTMKPWDNLILDVHSYQDEIQMSYDLSKPLWVLEQEYLASERLRYEKYWVADKEKANTVNHYKRFFPGIKISAEDLGISFEMIDDKLIDVTTIKKPIVMHGFVVFPAWHQFRAEWPTLDMDFFRNINEPTVEETLKNWYDNKFTHDFIYRYLATYGLSKYNTELLTNVRWKSVSITLKILEDLTVTHENESLILKQWMMLDVMSSNRKTDPERLKTFTLSPFQVKESLVISRWKYLEDVQFEMMRTYVLQKA